MLLVFATVMMSVCDVTLAACPWNEEGLLRWSSASTWDTGKVPKYLDQVWITFFFTSFCHHYTYHRDYHFPQALNLSHGEFFFHMR
jgi:hypothetical protein